MDEIMVMMKLMMTRMSRYDECLTEVEAERKERSPSRHNNKAHVKQEDYDEELEYDNDYEYVMPAGA